MSERKVPNPKNAIVIGRDEEGPPMPGGKPAPGFGRRDGIVRAGKWEETPEITDLDAAAEAIRVGLRRSS